MRSPVSPGSSPRNRSQRPRRTDNDIVRGRRSPRSNTPAETPVRLSRKDSKIPTLVRQSAESELVTKTRSADGDTANSTPRSDTKDRETEFSHRRSSSTVKNYETSAQKSVAPSRIPRSALRLSEPLNRPATSDSAMSSPRRTDKSKQSSPSQSPRCTDRKTQRKSTSDKVVPGKSQPSPSSGISSTPRKNELPRDDEHQSVDRCKPGEKQEQSSPADLIIQAFASRAPLRSNSSPRSKAAIMQQTKPRTDAAEKVNRVEEQAETRASQQRHQTDAELETSLSLPVGDMSPRQLRTSNAQQHDKMSRQSSPSLSPAPKKYYSSSTKTKRQPTTTTASTMMSESVETSQSSPRITDKPDYPANFSGSLVSDAVTCETAASISSRNRLQSTKISKSSTMGKKSGQTPHQKQQDTDKSTTSTKAKNVSDAEKSSPRYISTATGDKHRQHQLSSLTAADELRTKRGSTSFDVVDGDSLTESPCNLLSLNDEDDSFVTGAKRKTRSSVSSKQIIGASGTSASQTDLYEDDDDETETIASMVDKLRRRININDNQLAPLHDDAGQTANDDDLSSDVIGAWPAAAAAADSSHVAMDAEDILAEPCPPRLRKSRRKVKSRGRPAAPERSLTWIANSAAMLEEYSNDIHDNAAERPCNPHRDRTWTEEDNAEMSVKYSDEIYDVTTGPLRQKADVVDSAPDMSARDAMKLETPFNEVKTDNHQHRLPRHRSVEGDKTEEARLPHSRKSDATSKPHLHNNRSHINRSSPPPSPPFSSVPWNSESRGSETSPIMSRTNNDGEDDFEPVEDLTDEQDVESVASEMHMRWMETVDGYTTLLERCHSYASDATMARRLNELRCQTAALIDAQKQLYDVVDPEIMHRMGAMRRRAERLGRQVVTAGSEPGCRQWMVRRAESELSVVSEVAVALKQYIDNDASRTHNLQRYDTGTTYKSIVDAERGSESPRVKSETLRRCDASDSRPATTTSDKPVTRLSRRQTRHSNHDDSSPRLAAAPIISEGDVPPDVRQQQPAHHVRIDNAEHIQSEADNYDAAALVRRPSRRRRSAASPQPVNGGGAPRQQPQPITSIHFDSGEIDSPLPGSDANDDGMTWGLDADRCMFETTFPVHEHDRHRAPRARLPALSDDEQDNCQRSDLEEDRADQQRPGQGLRRWRTLEDIYHSSMDSVVFADDDGGGGDTEDRWMPSIQKRHTSPEHSRRTESNARTITHSHHTHRRSISVPNRSIVGFFVDSDCNSADESFQNEAVDEYHDEYRHLRRDDGDGDRWSDGDEAELLELEAGSEDWLDVQREIYRTHSRAELMLVPPSPRKKFQQSTNTVSSRVNKQPVRTLSPTTGVAGPTVGAIEKNEVPQRFHRSTIPTTDSTSEIEKQPTFGIDSRVQILLLVLLTFVLLGGYVYKYSWPSTLRKPEPPPPETSWSDDPGVLGYINTYMTDVFE